MNSPFQRFIDSLSDDEIEQLVSGSAGIGCDAAGYRLVKARAPLLDGTLSVAQVRAELKVVEEQILAQLYSQQALCRDEFDYQASGLFVAQGAARFCRHDGNRDNWALMIDEWRLVAVGPDDVRSQYGYFCEAEGLQGELEAEVQVMKWLSSGGAYEDYRTKTHCRYCM